MQEMLALCYYNFLIILELIQPESPRLDNRAARNQGSKKLSLTFFICCSSHLCQLLLLPACVAPSPIKLSLASNQSVFAFSVAWLSLLRSCPMISPNILPDPYLPMAIWTIPPYSIVGDTDYHEIIWTPSETPPNPPKISGITALD